MPEYSDVADALLAFASCFYTVEEIMEQTGVSMDHAKRILKVIEALRD